MVVKELNAVDTNNSDLICEKLNENLVYPLNSLMNEIKLDFDNEIMELNGKPHYYVICPHCRITFVKEIK